MANKSRETTFRFKQFTVSNRRSAMKVGTDGVLLGAWCAIPEGGCHVIDAGCGTGVIALMIAQRNPQANILGIEIDREAASEATENVDASVFAGRIDILHRDFLGFKSDTLFDLIVCNPPFFTESTKSPIVARANARTEGSLSVKSLLEKSVKLLSEEGSVAFIAPATRDSEIIFDAALAGLYPLRHCHVITVAGKTPQRTLWQFSRQPRPDESTTLIMSKSPGIYSKEYTDLVKEFYINL